MESTPKEIHSSFEISQVEIDKIEAYASRRRTSVLVIFFDDMQGSSVLKQKLSQQLGEEAFQKLRREHDQLLTEIITREGAGEVIKSTGDGMLAVFSEPTTAVERSLDIQEAYLGHPYIRLRIGLDMGQVRIERAGGVQGDMFGRHVDWASRAESMAEGGHILVTKSVYNDASDWVSRSRVSWKDHGCYYLKKNETPIELFEPYNANLSGPMAEPRGTRTEIAGQNRRQTASTAVTTSQTEQSAQERKYPVLLPLILVGGILAGLIAIFSIFFQKQELETAETMPVSQPAVSETISIFSPRQIKTPFPIQCSSDSARQQIRLDGKEIHWIWHDKTAAFCGWMLDELPVNRFDTAFVESHALVVEYTGTYTGNPSPQVKFIDYADESTRLVESGHFLEPLVENLNRVVIPLMEFGFDFVSNRIEPGTLHTADGESSFDANRIRGIQFDAGWDSPEGDIRIKSIYFQKIM